MVLDTVDSGFVVKQNIRQQILWKRKLFQRKGSKVKGAGLPFRGMPPVPPPGSCRLLKKTRTFQTGITSWEPSCFSHHRDKMPKRRSENEDLFQFKITEGASLGLLGSTHLGQKNIMAGNMEEHFQLLVNRKQEMRW